MAQEHQEYIQTKVNPILESLVTQVLLERPEDPAPFMIKWLADQAKTASGGNNMGKRVEPSELEKLKETLAALQESVKTLESRIETDNHVEYEYEDEEEDEEDDVDDSEMFIPKNYAGKGPRQSVSAEAYGEWNKKKEFVPKIEPKTDEQKNRIKSILSSSFLFANLDEKDFDIVIGAMIERPLQASVRIINQGEDGDVLYVIEKGTLDCFKKFPGQADEVLVKTCNAGDAFGELALLYNCPRAASVETREESVLWQLDRETFNAIVKDAASKKREMYENFLKSVSLLDSVEAYERMQIADALKSEVFNEGDHIVKQGDPGEKFYFIEEGSAVATKQFSPEEEPQEVMQYARGDYFGELALLKNEPRAANVIATGKTKVVYLDRRTFSRLLGPLEQILKRNQARYN